MFGSLQSIRLLKQTISSSFFIYHFFLFIILLYIVIYSLKEKGPCTWAASPPKEPLPSLIPSVLTASALQGFPKCAGSTLELLVKHFKRALLKPPQTSLVKLSKHLSRVSLAQCWGVEKQLSCQRCHDSVSRCLHLDPVYLMVGSSLWCYWLNLGP